jgi:hypothetical protein
MGARDARYLPYTPDAEFPRAAPVPSAYDCVLLGTWTWGPNRVGLDWFIAEVLPKLGTLSIGIGGRGSDALAGVAANLHAFGEVPDATAFLRSGRVILIPSTAGFGLQTKTLTALAAGRLIVATPLALRHIDERPPHLFIAGTGDAFAVAIQQALNVDVPGPGDILAARRERYRATLLDALTELRR